MDTLVFIIVALVVGVWAGGSFARFKSARNNLRSTKAMVGGLRNKWWENGFHSLRAILFVVGLIFVFYLGLRASGRI